MPIYEYLCPECGNKFELMRPISKSSEPADCPKCKHKAERTVSKFVSRNGGADAMSSSDGGSSGCSSCSGGSCSTCGG